MASVRRKVGDIVAIKLADGCFGFGRVLDEPLMAFYNHKADGIDESVEEIISHSIIFKVWVMNSAITSGRWVVIGNKPIDEELKMPAIFYKQDFITKKLYLYCDGKQTSASFEECFGLEKAAVWEAGHIEDRLMDYFLGKSNKWVEMLRLKRD